ncbi:MAG TPA: formate dehydrogenase accessory protein FdhE [Planctomycetota bacterium]|nr:formate dehydrogenase accessory protein FdhE [Planctomycetota bacterium]
MDWARAIARTEELAERAPDLLAFTRAVLRFQQDVYRRASTAKRKDPQHLDTQLLASFVPDFLELVEKHGPRDLAVQAQKMHDRQDWEGVLRTCWQQSHDRHDLLARLILQPFVQHLSERWRVEVGLFEDGGASCPFCSRGPLLSVDRGRRLLYCSLCANEWAFPEKKCPGCGAATLKTRRMRAMPHVHIEACETCGHYLKSIDLKRVPDAVPVVDEIAAHELDKAARAEGLLKFELNLAGQ